MTSPFYYFYNSITCELLISLSSSDKLLNISIISSISFLSYTSEESKHFKTSFSLNFPAIKLHSILFFK